MPQQRKTSSLDFLSSELLLSLVLLLLFFQLAREFAMAILRFGFGAGGQTLRWVCSRSGLLGSSSGSSSSTMEISLLEAAEEDSISQAAVAGRCNRSRFCGNGTRLNLAGRGAVLGGVLEAEDGSVPPPSRQPPLDLDEGGGGGDGCGATSFSITARTTHWLAGDAVAATPRGGPSKISSEVRAAAAAFLGRVSSPYTQLLQGALAALAAGESLRTAAAAAARELGEWPSVVKGREMFPALPLLSRGDETSPSQSPLHMANLRVAISVAREKLHVRSPAKRNLLGFEARKKGLMRSLVSFSDR